MRFTMEFSLDNDAFVGEDGELRKSVIAETIRRVAEKVEDSAFAYPAGAVHDVNGNRIGEWKAVKYG